MKEVRVTLSDEAHQELKRYAFENDLTLNEAMNKLLTELGRKKT